MTNKYSVNGLADTLLFLPAAAAITPCLHRIGLTPNMVTSLSIIFWFLGITGVFFEYTEIGCALFLFYYILDCADGILARTYKQTSDFGELYDYSKDWIFFLIGGLFILQHFGVFYGLMPLAYMIMAVGMMSWTGAMDSELAEKKGVDLIKENERRFMGKGIVSNFYVQQVQVCAFLNQLFFGMSSKSSLLRFLSSGDFVIVITLSFFLHSVVLIFSYAFFVAIFLLKCLLSHEYVIDVEEP